MSIHANIHTPESLGAIMIMAAESIRPPERLTVSETAEKYRWLNVPGAYTGW